MPRPLRPSSLAVLLTATAAVAGGLVGAAPASAASSSVCTSSLSAALATHDPTTLEDRAVVRVRAKRGAQGVRIALVRGSRTYASGTAKSVSRRGRPSVALKVRRVPKRGTYRVVVRGRVAGCGTVRRSSRWTMRRGSLPVRVALRGTTVANGRTTVSVLVRTVGRHTTRRLALSLRDGSGHTVASARVKGRARTGTTVALTAPRVLSGGRYGLRLTGTSSGASSLATQTLDVAGSAAGGGTGTGSGAAADTNPSRQHAVLDWSGGNSSGKDVVGVVLPGIGTAEVVCRPDTQWLRVFPSQQSHEISMLNWTYRDWGGGREKALREALHTTNTGPDFLEGFNKFAPAEKTSTGEFDAIVTDRGTIGAPGGEGAAPPVAIDVRWVWDFTNTGSSRCHVEADVTAQTAQDAAPRVRSAQVEWRGEAAAPNRTTAATDVPGVGTLNLVCEPKPGGRRTLTLETARGGTVTSRQGSVDNATPQDKGPITAQLPNNGQLRIAVAGGGSVLVSSRWKVNDPVPDRNSCAVSAQAVGTN